MRTEQVKFEKDNIYIACICMMMGQLMILIKIIDDFDHNERKCWAAYQCSQWPLEP